MRLVDNVRDRAQRTLGRPIVYLSAEWDRMAPRERRWVAGLSIAVVAVAVSLGIYLVFTSISDLDTGNAEIREALAAINKHRDEFLEARTRTQTQEARLGVDPPQLTADIEAAAREEEVQIAESSERRPGLGKRWTEQAVDLKIRGIDLYALTEFMRRIETGTRPIFVTQLSIKRRYSEADKLDAELTATAFERVKTKEAAKTDAKAGAGDEAADKDKGKAKTEKDRGAPGGAKGERR